MPSDQDPRLATIADIVWRNAELSADDLAAVIVAALDTPRPMEEAPEDGTAVLAVVDGFLLLAYYDPDYDPYVDEVHACGWRSVLSHVLLSPTGWLPLPRVKGDTDFSRSAIVDSQADPDRDWPWDMGGRDE